MRPIRHIGSAQQIVFLPSTIAPSEMTGYDGGSILRQEKLRFFEPIEDFPSLRPVELPFGWKIVELEQNKQDKQGNITRYELYDEDKRLRAHMRFKARWHVGIAPRIVSAETRMDVLCPFQIHFHREPKTMIGATLKHGKKQIFKMPSVPVAGLDTNAYRDETKVSLLAMLDEAFPRWKTSAEYWQSKLKRSQVMADCW